MLCVTDVREGIKLGVVSSLWCQVSKFCEVFLSCDGKLGLQLNSKWLKVRAWLCYWNLNLLCIPNDMRLIYRSQHKKMVLTFLSSLSVSLPVSTAGFHQHSQGDLWEDPGGSVWYQQWGEILCSSCVGFFFLPEPPSLFFVLLFPSPLLPQCGFAAVCVWFAMLPLFQKEGEKSPPLSFLWLQPSKTPSVPPLLCSIFHTHSLHFLVCALSLSQSPCLTLSVSLSASCQLINSSHPTRSQSLGKKTNTQPASQTGSCPSSQIESLWTRHWDSYHHLSERLSVRKANFT